ncbi:cardiotrophin-2-like [Hemitrygon akajei]|uniref:cardiotrophin-2-like n=1 Tax=Hemitrygon akajei TaxID=2704970 RepID=UPI003BF9BFD6
MNAAFTLIFFSLGTLASAAPLGGSDLHRSFSKSATLTRKVQRDVQELLTKYKEVRFGAPSFEDNTLFLGSLPSGQMTYTRWLDMQDTERLRLDCKDLQAFWIHVDSRHLQELSKPLVPTLVRLMETISLDLRDLISQLRTQIRTLNTTVPDPSDVSYSLLAPSTESDWISNLKGYIIFRDLETYLNKVIRDFLLLKTKY